MVVCQITSNPSSGFREYNVSVEPGDVCLYGDAFMRPSLVKPYIVFSVSKKEVRFKIGVLSKEKANEVKEKLRKLFDEEP